jgi:hypothetical protein
MTGAMFQEGPWLEGSWMTKNAWDLDDGQQDLGALITNRRLCSTRLDRLVKSRR